jgi:lipopolysaccharide/colanic/teichoic acid biosynthesis glycosyltransferase
VSASSHSLARRAAKSLAWIAARISSGSGGFFRQQRVGRDGRLFRIVKLRTMRPVAETTTATARSDPRITGTGAWLRRLKLDELPQLWNVLVGDMSLVGPLPDVPGFADRLDGESRALLTLRPGITGPATLAFKHEEELLDGVADPERYNSEVIYPAKVEMNLRYLRGYSFRHDLVLILATFLPGLRARVAPPFAPPS